MNTYQVSDQAQPNGVAPEVLEVIRSTEQELVGLLQRRAEIARRMAAIKQMLPGLVELFGTSVLEGSLFDFDGRARGLARQRGLTRGCRTILSESPAPLRIRDACEALQNRFPELVKHHKDLRASVATVFHRLAGYGEARCFLDEEGFKVWEWKRASDVTES